jgi:hypothetical protein
MSSKHKFTRLFCLRKDGLYVAWDGKTMTEKPHEGIRLSRTLCELKYRGYEMIPFPEAYDQWYKARQEAKA